MGKVYNHRWDKERKHYLLHHPLCTYCLEQGKTTAATVVDHIQPHKGDMDLFWDVNNWQALCKHCHDSIKQREEKRGRRIGYDVSGIPLGGWK